MGEFAGGDYTEHKRRLPILSDASDGPDIMQTGTGIKNQYRQLYVKH